MSSSSYRRPRRPPITFGIDKQDLRAMTVILLVTVIMISDITLLLGYVFRLIRYVYLELSVRERLVGGSMSVIGVIAPRKETIGTVVCFCCGEDILVAYLCAKETCCFL
ncbi:hypothetical protein BJX99DRAFT_255580 [Aspergillus californicus]